MRPRTRLRELRKLAGLTQAQLANLTGVSQPAISQIENDETPLTIDHMRTFGRVFGCAPADLLSDDDNPHRLADDELALINNYRSVDEAQRELVHRVAEPTQGFKGPRRNAA